MSALSARALLGLLAAVIIILLFVLLVLSVTCDKDMVYTNLMRCFDNKLLSTAFYRREYTKHPFLVTTNHRKQKITFKYVH